MVSQVPGSAGVLLTRVGALVGSIDRSILARDRILARYVDFQLASAVNSERFMLEHEHSDWQIEVDQNPTGRDMLCVSFQ